MDNETNPREELYNRFKEALRQPVGERFFDEDELVEIYDYAGDRDDDYVQLEVLLCGVRLYPESVPLTERKALLYLDTTDDRTSERTKAAENFLKDNPEVSSTIFDIARLEINPPTNAPDALEYLLSQHDTFNDEEIIRFVDLAIDLDAYAWLIENFDRISDKVPYKPSLLYEIAREADDRNDNETLIRMADALIELEPFTATYWMMLLRGQARLDRNDEARQTFEYAKALAGDAPDAVMALVDIVYHNAPYLLRELVEPMKRLVADHPDDFSYTDGLCAVYSQLNYKDSIITALLKDYVNAHPGHGYALRQLLMFNTRDAKKYIDIYFDTLGPDDEPDFDVEELTASLCIRSAFDTAAHLIGKIFHRTAENNESVFATMLEIEFRLQNYEHVVELCTLYQTIFALAADNPFKGMATIYIYVLSLIKTKRYDEALAFAKERSPRMQSLMRGAPIAIRMSIRCLLTFFDKIRRHPADEELYWEYFDMLALGKF